MIYNSLTNLSVVFAINLSAAYVPTKIEPEKTLIPAWYPAYRGAYVPAHFLGVLYVHNINSTMSIDRLVLYLFFVQL